MWENRKFYNGLSVLPFSDHSYKQAPFEDTTKEVYDSLINTLHSIDLSHVIESSDNTDLKGEVACAGGQCEVA